MYHFTIKHNNQFEIATFFENIDSVCPYFNVESHKTHEVDFFDFCMHVEWNLWVQAKVVIKPVLSLKFKSLLHMPHFYYFDLGLIPEIVYFYFGLVEFVVIFEIFDEFFDRFSLSSILVLFKELLVELLKSLGVVIFKLLTKGLNHFFILSIWIRFCNCIIFSL